jgi:hypothetical protein
MNFTININTNAVVAFTRKLERLHRSALPNAIRGALNKAAFDVKQNTMPRSADSEFIKRSPNFFKANSKVDMAQGFAVNQMRASVGFISNGIANNYAVDELEQQERGGLIKRRSFVATDIARGGSAVQPVRPGNRLKSIKKIANVDHVIGKNSHEKFIKSAVYAGKGGYVISNGMLWRIDAIKTKKVKVIGRYSATKVKATPIYSFDAGRSVSIKGTGFMRRASIESANKLDDFYISEAKRQIERLKQ